ncbi:MAG: guanylate kinase [Saprospiraceae bacterium]
MSKLIVITAPSGAGKTSIVKYLLKHMRSLAFSVSATNRLRRTGEVEGRDYYFIDTKTFQERIQKGDFLEYEEVYENQFYGTLKSEIERLWAMNKHIIFDIDVKGAVHIKEFYGDNCLTIFVKPPSKEVLLERLKLRKTETPESLKRRFDRAAIELTYENKFDKAIVNDILAIAQTEALQIVKQFVGT